MPIRPENEQRRESETWQETARRLTDSVMKRVRKTTRPARLGTRLPPLAARVGRQRALPVVRPDWVPASLGHLLKPEESRHREGRWSMPPFTWLRRENREMAASPDVWPETMGETMTSVSREIGQARGEEKEQRTLRPPAASAPASRPAITLPASLPSRLAGLLPSLARRGGENPILRRIQRLTGKAEGISPYPDTGIPNLPLSPPETLSAEALTEVTPESITGIIAEEGRRMAEGTGIRSEDTSVPSNISDLTGRLDTATGTNLPQDLVHRVTPGASGLERGGFAAGELVREAIERTTSLYPPGSVREAANAIESPLAGLPHLAGPLFRRAISSGSAVPSLARSVIDAGRSRLSSITGRVSEMRLPGLRVPEADQAAGEVGSRLEEFADGAVPGIREIPEIPGQLTSGANRPESILNQVPRYFNLEETLRAGRTSSPDGSGRLRQTGEGALSNLPSGEDISRLAENGPVGRASQEIRRDAENIIDPVSRGVPDELNMSQLPGRAGLPAIPGHSVREAINRGGAEIARRGADLSVAGRGLTDRGEGILSGMAPAPLRPAQHPAERGATPPGEVSEARTEAAAAPAPDIESIARDVYQILKRRLAREKERSSGLS
jgi:hypothetical protein